MGGSITHMGVDYGVAVVGHLLETYDDHSAAKIGSSIGIGVLSEVTTLYSIPQFAGLGWILRLGGVIDLQDQFRFIVSAPVSSSAPSSPVFDGLSSRIVWRLSKRPVVPFLHAGIVHERATDTIVPTIGFGLALGAAIAEV